MEFRDYIKIYWAQRWFIFVLTGIAVVAAVAIAATRPVMTGVSMSFAINRTNKEATTQYQYDGYYALQASDLFAQTVVSWFSTPSVLREVYDQANLDPEIQSLNSLPSRFSVKKYSAQNIVVRYTERDDERANKLADALKTVMEDKASQLNQTTDGKSIFEIVAGAPVVAAAHPNIWLAGAVALVLGLALALFIAAARHFLR
ncbi:MAG: hypothetical protein HY975_02720 [Candidatus Kerfeldbacteria bacterium]|nr:hypothetical protein [Candidatus Kerfeldbacteria bacterium]